LIASAASRSSGETASSAHKAKQPAKGSRARSRERPRGAAGRSGGEFRDPLSVGERPQAPWHPLPLSELLILVGAIGTIVGFQRGLSHGGPPLFAGLAAVLIGTLEVTLREHLSGYRSHTLILSLLPVIVFHSAVVLIVSALTRLPAALNVALLAVDAALGVLLFKLLRARFLDARRERTFAGRR
jgi:hypothetical protein